MGEGAEEKERTERERIAAEEAAQLQTQVQEERERTERELAAAEELEALQTQPRANDLEGERSETREKPCAEELSESSEAGVDPDDVNTGDAVLVTLDVLPKDCSQKTS